jgi:hypothetical protein
LLAASLKPVCHEQHLDSVLPVSAMDACAAHRGAQAFVIAAEQLRDSCMCVCTEAVGCAACPAYNCPGCPVCVTSSSRRQPRSSVWHL